MDEEKSKTRNKMMTMAEGLELTRLIDKTIEHGRLQVLDATPCVILYRITFRYFEKWCDINKDIIHRLIRMLNFEHRIVVVDRQYETCNYSLLEHIREALRRNQFVREHIIFRLDMQDYDAVLDELKMTLGICTFSNP